MLLIIILVKRNFTINTGTDMCKGEVKSIKYWNEKPNFQ